MYANILKPKHLPSNRTLLFQNDRRRTICASILPTRAPIRNETGAQQSEEFNKLKLRLVFLEQEKIHRRSQQKEKHLKTIISDFVQESLFQLESHKAKDFNSKQAQVNLNEKSCSKITCCLKELDSLLQSSASLPETPINEKSGLTNILQKCYQLLNNTNYIFVINTEKAVGFLNAIASFGYTKNIEAETYLRLIKLLLEKEDHFKALFVYKILKRTFRLKKLFKSSNYYEILKMFSKSFHIVREYAMLTIVNFNCSADLDNVLYECCEKSMKYYPQSFNSNSLKTIDFNSALKWIYLRWQKGPNSTKNVVAMRAMLSVCLSYSYRTNNFNNSLIRRFVYEIYYATIEHEINNSTNINILLNFLIKYKSKKIHTLLAIAEKKSTIKSSYANFQTQILLTNDTPQKAKTFIESYYKKGFIDNTYMIYNSIAILSKQENIEKIEEYVNCALFPLREANLVSKDVAVILKTLDTYFKLLYLLLQKSKLSVGCLLKKLKERHCFFASSEKKDAYCLDKMVQSRFYMLQLHLLGKALLYPCSAKDVAHILETVVIATKHIQKTQLVSENLYKALLFCLKNFCRTNDKYSEIRSLLSSHIHSFIYSKNTCIYLNDRILRLSIETYSRANETQLLESLFIGYLSSGGFKPHIFETFFKRFSSHDLESYKKFYEMFKTYKCHVIKPWIYCYWIECIIVNGSPYSELQLIKNEIAINCGGNSFELDKDLILSLSRYYFNKGGISTLNNFIAKVLEKNLKPFIFNTKLHSFIIIDWISLILSTKEPPNVINILYLMNIGLEYSCNSRIFAEHLYKALIRIQEDHQKLWYTNSKLEAMLYKIKSILDNNSR